MTTEEQMRAASGYVAALRHNHRTGQLAELRRLRDGRGSIAAFWPLVERCEIAERDEPFWLAVIPLMVEHPHVPGRRPGKALAEAHVAKPRVEAWLRMDRDRAVAEARRFLAPVKGGLDWVAFGGLLAWWTEERRRGLARDFFRTGAADAGSDGNVNTMTEEIGHA